MLCVGSDGVPRSYDGNTCPTGTVPYSGPPAATSNTSTLGSGIPYQADLRPVGTEVYSAGRYNLAGAGSVYASLEDFKRLRIKNPSEYRQIVKEMRQAGLISDRVKSDVTIAEAYNRVLEVSAESVAMGDPRSARQILSELASGEASVTGAAGRGAGAGAGAGRQARFSVELPSETEAYTVLNDMARDLIGRDLNEQEIKKYTQMLAKRTMESPRVSTPMGATGTVYSGGVDREEVARQLISDHPEYAGYQLNHQIMDVMLRDIDEGQSFLNEWS